jgi:Flp pilus assembly protein TadG
MAMCAKHEHRRGQTTILFVLALVPLLGMAGLAVDVGRMYSERRHAQATADLAASAGAQEVSRNGAHATFDDVATTYAARNGFMAANGDAIVLNNPPTSGPYAGNSNAYEVIVRRPVSTTLLRTFGTNSSTVEGRAVAVVQKSGIGIIVLQADKKDAFKMNKKSAINLEWGTLHVNSKDKEAIHIQDESQLTLASKAGVVGGYKVDGKAKISPPPETGVDPIPDPLADLPKPPCGLPTRNGTAAKPETLHISKQTKTLCPGIYWGGLKIDDNSKVTFDTCGMPPDEAVFVFTHDGFHLHRSDLVGDGVTIFNTVNSWCGGQGKSTKKGEKCGSLHFDAKSTTDLTPPTSGPWEGITVFEDPSCNKKFDISGSALSGLQGEVYLPNGELRLKGRKKSSFKGVIKASFVVKKMTVGNFIGTDEPDEDDGDEDDDSFGDEPDFAFNSTVGGSARRVVLAE